jgi:hypothetical protein
VLTPERVIGQFLLMRSLQAIHSEIWLKIMFFHSSTIKRNNKNSSSSSNNNNLILQTGWSICLFCSHCLRLFEYESPRQMDRRGRPIVWPPCSPDLMPFYCLLQGYVKEQVYGQRMIVLNEHKA